MFKNLILFLLMVIMVPFVSRAEWVSVNNSRTSNTPPKITILSDDDNSTVIKIEIAGFDLKNMKSEGNNYQQVDLLSEIFIAEPGSPELPYLSKILAIPDHGDISVEVINTGDLYVYKDVHLPAARESWYEGMPEPPRKESDNIYRSNEIYPSAYAKVGSPFIFRDFRLARVSFYPVRYLPERKELRVVSSLTVKINYNNKKTGVNEKTTPKKAIAPSFAKLYRSFIFNYDRVLEERYGGRENGREVILCIMPDDFVNSFQPYAEWKRQSGTDVHITKFSDIGANANNPQIIKDHITDAYHNWEYPPTYVLIVGDDGVFPKKIVTYDYSFPNEDFFVEIDGDDFFPEMMIGRFTNQGDYRLQVLINKAMKYEREPYTAETDWFKKGICCSNNAYESQVATKRFTARVMMEDGNFTSVDTLMSDGEWGNNCSMDLNDIKNAINEGRSYLNYRGEGWAEGWAANCYSFGVSDVSTLNNGEKLTFVTSIGCGVAMFDAQEGNCFGEEWLQLGSLSNPRGAIAFVGPTSNTHTTYNNKIDKGIYVGMFREGMDTPGQALLRGKLYMYNFFGDDAWVEYQYRVFTVLGDPSIHIWKDIPENVNVSYTSTFPVGYSQQEFTVTSVSSGLPVPNAEICLSGDDVFATGFTNDEGIATVDLYAASPEEITVTVRGGKVIPWQGTANIVQEEEHVGPSTPPEITDIDGNNNGLINPNENGTITFTLKNWGSQTAQNVQGSISIDASDHAEVVTTNPVSFGNLAPGASSTGDALQFYVHNNCPVGQIITIHFHVTSNNSSWDYQYMIEVAGCKLRYRGYIVKDEEAEEPNFRMDPGETVNLFLKIKNKGTDEAPNVFGVLRSNDPYITIIDSVGSFGNVNVGSERMNDENYYVVNIDASCPTNYEAAFSLKLQTYGGSYSYQTIREFTLPIGIPEPGDFTGPDAYGYYAYSEKDTLFDQAPEYDWKEIQYLGDFIPLPQNQSDYTKTISLPFDFKYYGHNYDHVRVSTDGWIAFGSGTETAPQNYPLPHVDNVNCMVAPFWDDLYDIEISEWSYLFYYHDTDNHMFIIEWKDFWHNDFYGNYETFEVILLDPVYYNTPTGDGEIIFQYQTVSKRDSNTIGIENETQDVGLQYVYNGEYDPTGSSIRGGQTAIKFTTQPPFLHLPVSVEETGKKPENVVLQQNFPNPFHTQTQIGFSLPYDENVQLKIYDIRGELINTLLNVKLPAGQHTILWNGRSANGKQVTPGVYLYMLQTDHFIKTMKLNYY
jgi:hypothetical protein